MKRNTPRHIVIKVTKIKDRDFPGGPVVMNPPSKAGDAGSIPGQGTKIPYATGQLSLCSAATESACSRAWVPQQESATHHNQRSPHTTTRDAHTPQPETPAHHN